MSDLRQRKFARTRLNLARVLADALGQQSFDEVSVKQLCRSAEVSEATFFNYFPRKQELLSYLVHLWVIELGWHVQKATEELRGLAVVDALFAEVARTCESRPGVLAEMLAWIARGGSLDSDLQIGELEKQLAYPDLDDIGAVPVKGIDAWLLPPLEAAISNGDLPENTLVPLMLTTLLSVLFGVPLTLLASDPTRIATVYRQQLALVLAGIRAAAGSQ
ncbi:MAG: TetR/AcrR family transcriptional regulator [Chromatiales bacterium]|nr:TetR/AcrR family transcriptional regulator [Chromatiales bacterium]